MFHLFLGLFPGRELFKWKVVEGAQTLVPDLVTGAHQADQTSFFFLKQEFHFLDAVLVFTLGTRILDAFATKAVPTFQHHFAYTTQGGAAIPTRRRARRGRHVRMQHAV